MCIIFVHYQHPLTVTHTHVRYPARYVNTEGGASVVRSGREAAAEWPSCEKKFWWGLCVAASS
jgi:hypothetical protein